MSRSCMSASGSPYVLDYYEFDGPQFADLANDPEKPVFKVATTAGERLDMARLEQLDLWVVSYRIEVE